MFREPDLRDRIASQPDRFGGEPYVVTVQVPVASVLEMLGHGDSPTDVFTSYPGIEQDDLLACLEFARARAEEAITKLQPNPSSEATQVDWESLQSSHGVSDEFLTAARQVFEKHDEILRRLA